MKEIVRRWESILWYVILGVLTTGINFVIYYLMTRVGGCHYLYANAVAWCGAVIFAYVTNRLFVFESKQSDWIGWLREGITFVACRAATGVLEMGLMVGGVSWLGYHDGGVKVGVAIWVVITNYILSKRIVFRGERVRG